MTSKAFLVAVVLAGCDMFTPKQVENAFFSTADILCIIAHAEASSSSVIADACQLTHDLEPAIRQVVAEHRVQVERAVSAKVTACRKDGGS